jgi:hypothetical protein
LLSHGLEPRSRRAPLSRAGVAATAPVHARSGTIHRYKVAERQRRGRGCRNTLTRRAMRADPGPDPMRADISPVAPPSRLAGDRRKQDSTQRTQRAANNANGPETDQQHSGPAPPVGHGWRRCRLVPAPFALFAALCVFCVESFLLSPWSPHRCLGRDSRGRATIGHDEPRCRRRLR